MSTKIPASHIQIKRAYEPPLETDGTRILIDRLWPRGVKKEALALGQWAKELAPSTDLRHDYRQQERHGESPRRTAVMNKKIIRRLLSERQFRRARLLSGLIIFLFLLMHVLNHSLGLISVSAADGGRPFFLSLWRNPVGTFVLYGAFIVHIVLVLRSIYLRRSLSMPKAEAAQIILGLAVPALLIDHILATRIASHLFHLRDSYETIVHSLWSKSPADGMKPATVAFANDEKFRFAASCSAADAIRSLPEPSGQRPDGDPFRRRRPNARRDAWPKSRDAPGACQPACRRGPC